MAKNVKKLYMQSCDTYKYSDGFSFINFSFLEYLDISKQNYQKINSTSFLNFNANISINICCNSKVIIEPLILNNVARLDFSNNKMSYIINIIESGTVTHLDLSENQITSWTLTNIFHSIEELNLSRNAITIFDSTMLESLNHLELVDLGQNPIDCGHCSLGLLQKWFASTNTKVYNIGSRDEPLSCTDWESKKLALNVNTAQVNSHCNFNYFFTIGLPLGVLVIIGIFACLFFYVYRYDIAFMHHLWRVKKKRQQR